MTDLPVEVEVGNLSGFIGEAIGEGLGSNATLRLLRESGVRIGNEAFRSLYRTVDETLSRRSEWAAMAPDVVPAADVFVPWEAGRAGVFGYQVDVHVREVGITDITTKQYTFMTDVRVPPGDALQAALDEFNANVAGQGTDFAEVVLGGVVTGGFQLMGRRRA